MSTAEHDYIVVGSGAGGGPLAANLANAGFRVLLLEAGGDPCAEGGARGRYLYEVPIFHGLSTEYPECAWNFFVRHYTQDDLQARDSKRVPKSPPAPPPADGKYHIWYPRAGALGGCTAHNAMITVIPQDSDWDYIAELTGDSSWQGENMRPYYTRLENCHYKPRPASFKHTLRGIAFSLRRLLQGKLDGWLDWRHGHGFKGWLPTSEADPFLVLKDKVLVRAILDAVEGAYREHIGDPLLNITTLYDPNDTRYAGDSPEGLFFTPLAVDGVKRTGPRDFILRTKRQCEERRSRDKEFRGELEIRQRALATRVLFEGTRAVGVEYIDKGHVYRADPAAEQETPDPKSLSLRQERVHAKGEVIVAGGAFNTPQLLKLSGVGPREELERFDIPVVVDLPGVGENLQDRYEVGVVSKYAEDFKLLEGATFAPPDDDGQPDEFLKQWGEGGKGIYASNGALIGIIKRSNKKLKDPDLYIFGLPGYFKGYEPGYSKIFEATHNKFTWAVLKARTTNTGYVRLASKNPWDRPEINFQYFGDGGRNPDPDLDAVVDGVHFVRRLNERLKGRGIIVDEEVPGAVVATDEQLRQFIRDEAWGHHASCTCKIGADNDRMAVLDSRFRVRGTEGLRVVDASVFPRIPGYFIVTAIYMISEKAFDVIREDADK
ncbi:MAG TPA: GMC oxidoreductase [Pyrinomonadaceae bacterium]|nr:GMC oxidoreductase [Pyrinomonadaceae bacterium]